MMPLKQIELESELPEADGHLVAGQRQFLFNKWANPGLFYHLFLIFSNKHHYYFYNKYMWKKYRFNIWCRDLNPQPLARESPPITTRPGSFLPRSSTTVTTATTTPMLSFVKKFFILKIRPSLDSPFLKVENDRGHCFDDTHTCKWD